MKRILGIALALFVGLAPLAAAQAARGNVYGNVTDLSGGVLPGATVTISGDFGANSTVTDATGKFRFLNLDQGSYTVTVELTGFATQAREIIVSIGANVDLTFALDISGVEETITVTAETPVVDIRKMGTETTVDSDELESIPTSRDPWALMRTVPGVQVDKLNVAGSESGQQSSYFGKGSMWKNNTWSMDGIVITDMSTSGSSPGYYTYDTFDEVNVTTGGSDITSATGGVHMSFVTKRGTNTPQGSFAFNWTDDALQSSNLPDELQGDPRLDGSDKANHTDNITDWSIDFGAPIIKDKLWAYGSFGRNEIKIKTLTQTEDRTLLKNIVAKVNWQATAHDNISFFYFINSKVKNGRSPGGDLIHLDEHLYDQGGAYTGQPEGLTKGEWNRVWSPNFTSSIKGARYDTGFTLAPRVDANEVYDYRAGVASGAPWDRRFLRPQSTFKGDANYFLTQGNGTHEIKFGLGWKKNESNTTGQFQGDGLRLYFYTDREEVRFNRDAGYGSQTTYWSGYIGDTFTLNRMTLNLGLRWDRQNSINNASEIPGNALIPDLLPGISYPGGGTGILWNNISPRVGFTYALDEEFRTIVRGSFARYHGQLQTYQTTYDNPLGSSAYLQYAWDDANGDREVQLPEVDFNDLRTFGGLDPNNPGAIGETPDEIDPDYTADTDYEFVLGVDREVMTDFALGVAYTWRRSSNIEWYPFIGVTSADYELGDPVTTNGYTSTPYVLRDGVLDRPDVTGGQILENHDDYRTVYQGIELTLNKRLSNKWMSRVAFSWGDWKEYYDAASAIQNPTINRDLYSSAIDGGVGIDGGKVLRRSSGSGNGYFTTASWQVNISGLYQLPAGFDFSGNLYARQGYPQPLYHQLNLGVLDGTRDVLAVNAVDDVRLDTIMNLDLRFAKNFTFGRRSATVAFELFNALNGNTPLNRYLILDSSNYNRLDEIMAPRIARLVARIRF
jgi:hypothetical protein